MRLRDPGNRNAGTTDGAMIPVGILTKKWMVQKSWVLY